MSKIIALDIGIASVGWAVVDKEREHVVEAGSNLFPEASAAENASRRGFRQGKRLQRRRKTRENDFKNLWKKEGFQIPLKTPINVVELCVKGLDFQLKEDEIYTVLYYRLKHRGISYLDDADDGSNGSSGAYAKGLEHNQEELKTKFPCQIQLERLKVYGQYRGQNETVDNNGEIIDLNNVFTTSSYAKEIRTILEKQQEFNDRISDEFIDSFLMIFNRKRKYYEGPGNELSRTDYGKYTTKVDPETGKFITEDNIFFKLIGKCSIYPDELRLASASYTAQEFNFLNDMNNLTINGRKLDKEEKESIAEIIKNSDSINVRKIISKVMGEDIESMSGARIDKSDKELFHTFEVYNKIRKELRNIDIDIKKFDRDELDEIGEILTNNTDRESLINGFNCAEFVTLTEEEIECLIKIRKNNGSLFNKHHSFSKKIMMELIPEMYMQSKEQMTILTEMGYFKSNEDIYKNIKYIPVDAVSDELLNPVVRRSVRISFKIVNALLKKYIDISDIVIEMPRDKNSEEKRNYIKEQQRKNEKEQKEIESKLIGSYDYKIDNSEYSSQKQLGLKLKLWNEQNGICLYSGREINPRDIVEHPEMFEVDHIIPLSISFDDSRSNKVLVYQNENQNKGNQTPVFYLTHNPHNNWDIDKFRATVVGLTKKKDYGISRKKMQNLLFDKDITKIEVLKGFISRNINDTRYASRVVLNTLQEFFKSKDSAIKVKVINGNYTHQMRVNMKLDKNREEKSSHHAVDAMLIAFSQLGYEAYHTLQGKFIDFETGEILDQRMFNEKMDSNTYKEYLYGMKWSSIRKELIEAEKNVKFWYYIEKKVNKGLCNQTIRGTREYEGKTVKINKFNIRTQDGVKLFKKLAFSDKEREKLLVFKNDRQTFDSLIKIFEDYSDAANPFVQYEKETGDYVRKYSKKGNGPKIECLKYTDGEVGACIDISHKYGFEKGSRKVILESLVPYRTDVYYNTSDNSYYLVGLKQSDIKCKGDKYVIDENAYTTLLLNENMIKTGQTRYNLEELGYEFRFSFYKNDYIEYEKGGTVFTERYLSRTMPKNKNYIETKPIDRPKFEKRNPVGLSKTSSIRKIRTDILGNRFYCDKEDFKIECN